MTAFSTAIQGKRPDAIVQIGPDAFKATWPHRPANSVAMGLILLSESDVMTVRAEASKAAKELHPDGPSDPNWNDAHNDELMAWALSLALCDPNDAATPYFAAHGQDEDIIAEAMTPQAIRHLWDELERVTITKSPVRLPASDEDIKALAELLSVGAIGQLATPFQVRARKLCSFLLDELIVVEDDV